MYCFCPYNTYDYCPDYNNDIIKLSHSNKIIIKNTFLIILYILPSLLSFFCRCALHPILCICAPDKSPNWTNTRAICLGKGLIAMEHWRNCGKMSISKEKTLYDVILFSVLYQNDTYTTCNCFTVPVCGWRWTACSHQHAKFAWGHTDNWRNYSNKATDGLL